MADPGFSPGGAPTPKIAIIFHIFAENCMKMKEFGPPGGGASLAPPLGSANASADILVLDRCNSCTNCASRNMVHHFLCLDWTGYLYSTIHKATSLMVLGCSMISTGTIPVEHKSVHWLSMGAAGRNHLWGAFLLAVFMNGW